MNARTLVVVAVAALLLAVQAGAIAFSAGFGPFDSGASGPEPATTPDPSDVGGTGAETPDGSSGDGGSGGSSGGSGTRTPLPPYDLDVLDTEECGNTCRDVTVRLSNNRDEATEGVVVRTRIYSGNTTADDARVWAGRRDVGTLEAGASTTTTTRVSLSYFEALSIQRNGGWITVVTVVESEDVTRTFRERRKVT